MNRQEKKHAFAPITVCAMALIFLSFLSFPVASPAQTAPATDTLDVVNWNIEWFADGTTHNPGRQTSKVRQLMNDINADVYALCEIVNVDSLRHIVNSLPGGYACTISTFGSFADDTTSSEYASAQKLALVYRTSMVRNVRGRALLDGSNNAYYNFSSGRFPYLVQTEIKGKDGQWHAISFIVMHAKADADYSSCQRRQWGATELKDTLDNHFGTDRFLLLGDYNDDLNGTICSSGGNSSYLNFVQDSTDNNSYRCITLPLSLSGVTSIQGYAHLIDHVIASNEMYPYYLPGSARSLKSSVKSWVSYYEGDVSDHYPILSRYVLDDQASAIPMLSGISNVRLYPNPAKDQVTLDYSGSTILETYTVTDLNGRSLLSGRLQPYRSSIPVGNLPDGIYVLRCSTGDGRFLTQRITVLK